MSATTNLGKVSVTPKGAWAITNAYEILDIVTSGGSSYLAKQDVPTGVSLSNTSYWIMIAEKGDGGEVTSASASISGGYGTPGVSVTAGGTAHERTLAFAFTNLRGEKGETGNGIDSVYKTGTSGLVDTYTILFTDGNTYEFEVNNGTASIDNTLTKSGWAADAKVVGDTKASIDGFYETMGVGVADNLTPYSEDSGATQSIPFIAQGTGCGNGESVVDTGSYLQFKKKLGNTVGVNQLAEPRETRTVYGMDFTNNDDGTATLVGESTNSGAIGIAKYLYVEASHKYLAFGDGKTPRIITGETAIQLTFEVVSGETYNEKFRPIIIDLTLWFGSNDRIPSDLLSHPENWGRYYAGSLASNAGTLESADGSILTSLPRNCFDGELESGAYDPSTGAKVPDANKVRSKNLIPCIPNETYYFRSATALPAQVFYVVFFDAQGNFVDANINGYYNATKTIPANAHFMGIWAGSASYPVTDTSRKFTLSIYYSGESGYDEDYDYSVLAEMDTGSEVLRSAGAVADEKTPDGTITRKVGVVDLGTLTWSYNTSGTYPVFIATLADAPSSITAGSADYHSSKYVSYPSTSLTTYTGTSADKTICRRNNNNTVLFQDSSYTSADLVDGHASWLEGQFFTYELATPTTEQGTAFAENIPCDDFGSMYWTQTKGIPQGNEIFYPVDYKASIDTLYNRVEGDMGAIVIDSQLEVVADRIPEAPSSDGTYTLKATVSSGTKTYSWVADE